MNVSRGRRSILSPLGVTRRAAALLALAAAMLSGCGGVCDDAVEHMEECGFEDNGRYGGASCDGTVECASECFLEAPCGAFDGTDVAAREKYVQCLDGC
jgi:hypothetical protein